MLTFYGPATFLAVFDLVLCLRMSWTVYRTRWQCRHHADGHLERILGPAAPPSSTAAGSGSSIGSSRRGGGGGDKVESSQRTSTGTDVDEFEFKPFRAVRAVSAVLTLGCATWVAAAYAVTTQSAVYSCLYAALCAALGLLLVAHYAPPPRLQMNAFEKYTSSCDRIRRRRRRRRSSVGEEETAENIEKIADAGNVLNNDAAAAVAVRPPSSVAVVDVGDGDDGDPAKVDEGVTTPSTDLTIVIADADGRPFFDRRQISSAKRYWTKKYSRRGKTRQTEPNSSDVPTRTATATTSRDDRFLHIVEAAAEEATPEDRRRHQQPVCSVANVSESSWNLGYRCPPSSLATSPRHGPPVAADAGYTRRCCTHCDDDDDDNDDGDDGNPSSGVDSVQNDRHRKGQSRHRRRRTAAATATPASDGTRQSDALPLLSRTVLASIYGDRSAAGGGSCGCPTDDFRCGGNASGSWNDDDNDVASDSTAQKYSRYSIRLRDFDGQSSSPSEDDDGNGERIFCSTRLSAFVSQPVDEDSAQSDSPRYHCGDCRWRTVSVGDRPPFNSPDHNYSDRRRRRRTAVNSRTSSASKASFESSSSSVFDEISTAAFSESSERKTTTSSHAQQHLAKPTAMMTTATASGGHRRTGGPRLGGLRPSSVHSGCSSGDRRTDSSSVALHVDAVPPGTGSSIVDHTGSTCCCSGVGIKQRQKQHQQEYDGLKVRPSFDADERHGSPSTSHPFDVVTFQKHCGTAQTSCRPGSPYPTTTTTTTAAAARRLIFDSAHNDDVQNKPDRVQGDLNSNDDTETVWTKMTRGCVRHSTRESSV